MKILVTGCSGLIGSEVCEYFYNLGHTIYGIDNNQREKFFGKEGDTSWRLRELYCSLVITEHLDADIRNRDQIIAYIKSKKPDVIIHTAAQPSHDKAASIPFDDFDTNAVGTLNLLEACRQHCPESPFIHMSTNKVYGDGPNLIEMKELDTRWELNDQNYAKGIPETFSIDQCTHSLFGSSKVAADIMVQEYGRYFNMPTCCLRGGCLTGPSHSGVELHGFLSYLIKCNTEEITYKIFGYKGKQVRDNIHSEDVARFIECFINNPRKGEVYNLGGGKENSCSILEAFEMCESFSGKKQKYEYTEENRIGDHICYYSDLSKIKNHYPEFQIKHSLLDIIGQMVNDKKNKKSDPIVILPRDDGFCSRVEGLHVVQWALEYYKGKEVVLIWPHNKACRLKFEDIFEIPEGLKVINSDVEWQVDSDNKKILLACEERNRSKKDLVYVNGRFLLPNRIEAKYSNDLVKRNKIKINYIRKLKYNSKFLNLIKETRQKYNITNDVIGIHIRSLESPKYYNVNEGELSGKKRIEKLIEYYVQEIGKLIKEKPEQKFLIGSDDKNIIKNIKSLYENNIIYIPRKYPKHDFEEGKPSGSNKVFERGSRSIIDSLVVVAILSEIDYNKTIKVDGSYGYFTQAPFMLKSPAGLEQFTKDFPSYWQQSKIFEELFKIKIDS